MMPCQQAAHKSFQELIGVQYSPSSQRCRSWGVQGEQRETTLVVQYRLLPRLSKMVRHGKMARHNSFMHKSLSVCLSVQMHCPRREERYHFHAKIQELEEPDTVLRFKTSEVFVVWANKSLTVLLIVDSKHIR